MEKTKVDVEKIMEEIKYAARNAQPEDYVEFKHISVEREMKSLPKVNEKGKFNWEKFWGQLAVANKSCKVEFVVAVPKGNLFVTFIRKVAVKLTRFYFKIVVNKQNEYNVNSVRTLNEIALFVQDVNMALNKQNDINMKFQQDMQEHILNSNKEYVKRLDAAEREKRFLQDELRDLKKQIEVLCKKQEEMENILKK